MNRSLAVFVGITLPLWLTIPTRYASAQETPSTRVPLWNARGLGPLPWQGIACVDMTADGKFIAVGTIAPPGDPNVFLLDADGKLLEQHAVGQRWINEVAVGDGGAFISAVCTSPTGAAGDVPAIFTFAQGKSVAEKQDGFAPLLFHYGDHSNHLARSLASTGSRLVTSVNGTIRWSTPGAPENKTFAVRYPATSGTVACLASNTSGRVVIGTVISQLERTKASRNLLVVEDGKAKPLWDRAVNDEVDKAAELPVPRFGPPAPPTRDFKVWAPLAVAIDAAGKHIAVADYQGWERVIPPPGDKPFTTLSQGRARSMYDRLGIRFVPARPTITVYDADGNVIRRFGPDTFRQPFWCDLAFSRDGQTLMAFPHNWTSRGLAGQPFLPADTPARAYYRLPIKDGVVGSRELPDAISDAAFETNDGIVVGCWNNRLPFDHRDLTAYDRRGEPNIGGPCRVRISQDGQRIVAATAQGVVKMLDGAGREVCAPI